MARQGYHPSSEPQRYMCALGIFISIAVQARHPHCSLPQPEGSAGSQSFGEVECFHRRRHPRPHCAAACGCVAGNRSRAFSSKQNEPEFRLGRSGIFQRCCCCCHRVLESERPLSSASSGGAVPLGSREADRSDTPLRDGGRAAAPAHEIPVARRWGVRPTAGACTHSYILKDQPGGWRQIASGWWQTASGPSSISGEDSLSPEEQRALEPHSDRRMATLLGVGKEVHGP